MSTDSRSALTGFTREELPGRLIPFLEERGEKRYRLDQIVGWIYSRGVTDFALMQNLPADLRTDLSEHFSILSLERAGHRVSRDGSEKFLWRTRDGKAVESVSMPSARKTTFCLSTQAGCPLGCTFCSTGALGFGRNLRAHEIVSQAVGMMERKQRPDDLSNVVFMGMGEPLLNYAELARAVRILNHPELLQIGSRRITVSTVGIPDGIRRLAKDFPQVKLAVSLNAADDTVRTKLMPINRKYPLRTVIGAVRYFTETTNKRVTFEYIIIPGVNDSRSAALSLRRLVDGIPCKVNLIALNRPGPGDFRAPTREETGRFRDLLMELLPQSVTVRRSMGRDILAACGQLAGMSDGQEPGTERPVDEPAGKEKGL